jgi:predicted neuraminidase
VLSLSSLLTESSRGLRWAVGLGVCIVLLGIEGALHPAAPPAAQAVWPAPELSPSTTWRLQAAGRMPMPEGMPAAHASSLMAGRQESSTQVQAYWFAGSRESGPDVQIITSSLDRESQQWSAPQAVVNRERVGRALGMGVRRIGNPVAWRDAQGRAHLFVVSTGLGGWAAGRILHLRQDSAQAEYQVQQVLPLSWLWNTSHLVRAMPLPLADGGMVLPVYFELGKKYPVALRFDGEGNFRGVVRMSSRGELLQPTLLMQTPTQWLALLRDGSAGHRVHAVQTDDGGQHWQDLPDLDLANPDASIAGLGLAPQVMALAHNFGPASRERLVLSRSADGLHWQAVDVLAQAEGAEFSYPSMLWHEGSLWVSYTDQRHAIAWQRFMPLPTP